VLGGFAAAAGAATCVADGLESGWCGLAAGLLAEVLAVVVGDGSGDAALAVAAGADADGFGGTGFVGVAVGTAEMGAGDTVPADRFFPGDAGRAVCEVAGAEG